MPGFPDSLFSISNLCDAGLHCTFTPTNVQAFDPKSKVVKLQGWRDPTSRLWRFPICDMLHNQVTSKQKMCHQVLSANNAYDLPSAPALIKYHHATAGFPVKETWCQAIKQGNYATWPGLTSELARRYCPNAEETTCGTMSMTRKNVRSSKAKVVHKDPSCQRNLTTKVTKSNEAYFFIRHSSKIYSDQTGKFPYTARSGNQYLMIVYVVDANLILATPFKNKTKTHLTEAYLKTKKELDKRGFIIDMHVLDNEASEINKDAIENLHCTY